MSKRDDMEKDVATREEIEFALRAASELAARVDEKRPSDTALAAFLEGRASEDERAAVEAWLLADESAPAELAALRAIAEEEPEFAPPALIAKAASLVAGGKVEAKGGAHKLGEAQTSGGLFGWLDGLFAWSRPYVYASLAAVMIIAAVGGFELGRSGVESLEAGALHGTAGGGGFLAFPGPGGGIL